MAYCTNCGSRIEGNLKFCTNCGAPLEPVEVAGLETMSDQAEAPQPEQPAYQEPSFNPQPSYQQPEPTPAQPPYQQPEPIPAQPSYQQQAGPAPSQQPTFIPGGEAQTAPVDTGSIGWAILGFIIPLVGLILFIVWRNTKPQSAKMSLIGAVVSVCLALIFQFIG